MVIFYVSLAISKYMGLFQRLFLQDEKFKFYGSSVQPVSLRLARDIACHNIIPTGLALFVYFLTRSSLVSKLGLSRSPVWHKSVPHRILDIQLFEFWSSPPADSGISGKLSGISRKLNLEYPEYLDHPDEMDTSLNPIFH